jgi:DNA polymerase-1
MIFDVPYDSVTKDQRQVAKSVEFAIVYGAGAAKVSSMSGISEAEAKQVMADVYKRMPEVNAFIKTANSIAKERKWVKTIKGRQVYVEKGREYACVNYIIQGSAADCTKVALRRINQYLRANHYDTKFILQVHDSCMFYVKDSEADIVVPKLLYLMAETELFRVPITADCGISTDGTWAGKEDKDIKPMPPSPEEQKAMDNYNIWEDTYEYATT